MPRPDQKYVCCNADEGDSGTFADRMVMEGDPFMLIEGMTIAGIAAGATRGFVYIRSEYPDAIAAMKEAIAAATAAKWLGDNIQGTDKSFRPRGPPRRRRLYLRRRDRHAGKPRGQARHGAAEAAASRRCEGLFGKPTVINNVLSFAAVPFILAKGGTAYKDYGMGRSRGTLPFQLAGNIKQGGLVEKAFGVTLRRTGRGLRRRHFHRPPVRAVQVGGPLGAYLPAAQLDLPMDYEAFAAQRRHGRPRRHRGLRRQRRHGQQARFAMEFCAIESCGKCTPCRIGSTRGVETIDKIIAGVDRDANLEVLEDLCQTMTDGSLCALGGLTPMPVMSAVKHFPEDFDKPARMAAE